MKKTKKIILYGSEGQVGWELRHTLAHLGDVISFNRISADFTQPDLLRNIIRSIKPDIIVNAAAYTAVDKAENEPDCAMMINGIAPGVIAEESKRCGTILVHYSTDYVFDGRSTTPYCEDALTNPLNTYGKTKLFGENAIQAVGGSYLIFRTSWVYGMRGRNFLLTMIKLAKEKKELKIVMDQHGAPTWSRTIAEATSEILKNDRTFLEDKWGVYNLTASGSTTWCQFAEAIFDLKNKKQDETFVNPRVIGITTSEFPSPVQRPKYSVLSHRKICETFMVNLPAWDKALEEVLRDSDLGAHAIAALPH